MVGRTEHSPYSGHRRRYCNEFAMGESIRLYRFFASRQQSVRRTLAWCYGPTGGDIEHAFLVHGEPESRWGSRSPSSSSPSCTPCPHPQIDSGFEVRINGFLHHRTDGNHEIALKVS